MQDVGSALEAHGRVLSFPPSGLQVVTMALLPLVVLGGLGVVLCLSGEGWWRTVGPLCIAASIPLSFWSRNRTARLRVTLDDVGVRIIDGSGRVASLQGAKWEAVADAALRMRRPMNGDGAGNLVLVLSDATGRDVFQLSPQLCSRTDTRAVVEEIKARLSQREATVAIPENWP